MIPAAAAKSTLCDPIVGSPPGSPVPGILQARTLEWAAVSCSNAWKWKEKVKSLSRVQLLETPWTAAHQAPPSMGFSRQEYCSGVPLPFSNNDYTCLWFKLWEVLIRGASWWFWALIFLSLSRTNNNKSIQDNWTQKEIKVINQNTIFKFKRENDLNHNIPIGHS